MLGIEPCDRLQEGREMLRDYANANEHATDEFMENLLNQAIEQVDVAVISSIEHAYSIPSSGGVIKLEDDGEDTGHALSEKRR